MQLNIRLKGGDNSASKTALQDASKRKAIANETIEDAWQRILAMKNSDADLRKLHEVKNAMERGAIGREPENASKRFSKAEALRLHSVLSEQQKEQKLADLVANTPSNYVLVTEVEQLERLVELAIKEPIIAVDTETTGLDVYVDVIVGVSLTLPTVDKHYYIPFEPTQDERAFPIEYLEKLRPVIENETVKKVLHNALYDMAMFRRHGIELKGVAWDTQHAMHMLNENEMSFRLKDLAPKYLRVESDTFDALFGKDARFDTIPLDIALVYAAKDTHLTWDLYAFQSYHMAQMPEMYEYYTTVEVPLLYVILDMEQHGYILDMDFAQQYGKELHDRAQTLYSELME